MKLLLADGSPALDGLPERIEIAWRGAGYASRSEMGRAAGLANSHTLYRWAAGHTVPTLMGAAVIARACRVSLDWLVWGEEAVPPSYAEWLEGEGASSTAEERAYLRSLPLTGYQASPLFWALALQAYRHGLEPAEVVDTARNTEQHLERSDP